MAEPASNIQLICPDCAREQPQVMRGPAGQLFRKVGFPCRPDAAYELEWMWVKVANEEARQGQLANEPAFADFTLGATYGFEPGPDGRMRATQGRQ
jgi:hypothetical protein